VDASAAGLGYKEMIEETKKFQPEIVALTAVTPSITKTALLASMIKDIYPSILIVIGGPHFTAVPEQTITDYPVFDYGVVGEGEHTIIDLVEALSADRIPSNVPGVAFRENGRIRFPPPAHPLRIWIPFRFQPGIFWTTSLPDIVRHCSNTRDFLLHTSYLQEVVRINVFFATPLYSAARSGFTAPNMCLRWWPTW